MASPFAIIGAIMRRRRPSMSRSTTGTTCSSDAYWQRVSETRLDRWLLTIRQDASGARFVKCLCCIRAAAGAIDADPERLRYATVDCRFITSNSARCDNCEHDPQQGQPCVAASAAMVRDEINLFQLLDWAHQSLDIFVTIGHSVVLDNLEWSKEDTSKILAAIKRLLIQFLAVESAHREEYQLDRVDNDYRVLLDYRNHYVQRHEMHYRHGLGPGDRGFAAWKAAKATFVSNVIDVVCGIEGGDWRSVLETVPISFIEHDWCI